MAVTLPSMVEQPNAERTFKAPVPRLLHKNFFLSSCRFVMTSERKHHEERPEDSDSNLKNVPMLTPEQERKLWRKIDLRLMPILSLMYLFSFLDRGNIGNAKLDGLVTQLDLTGNRYNIALTMFFIPYCLFECPANLVLKVFRPSRRMASSNQFHMGDIYDAHELSEDIPQLVGVRACLGFAEAGLVPALLCGIRDTCCNIESACLLAPATMAGAFSGLLAFAIGHMNGIAALEGWSWIFLLEGLATIVVAIIARFVLVDFPNTATFLTPEERAFVVWKKKYDNSSVGEEEGFAARHVLAAFRDWQVWLQILIAISIIGPLYGITLFLPTIIQSFGHDTPISQLLTVPPYVAATITLIIFAYYSDKLKMRFPFILAGLIMCLIGLSINISTAPNGVKYFGTFFIVIGSYAATPGAISWLGNNLSGQYKRGVGMALQIGIGNFSGAISAVIYRSQDSPRFILRARSGAHRINAHRDAAERLVMERGEKVQYSDEELRELGDRAPDFRYTL
ncbi:MFS general substrate transporter [Suillus ampliporus]|nr:MFS general substrate transporter [Suillus ampliporus]